MSDFKETCIWMSYRYAIGRKTIAAVTHAEDIARHIDWIPESRREFTAEDILRTINGQTNWMFKNVKASYTAANYDVFSVILEWLWENGIEDPETYFMQHEWQLDLNVGVVISVKERSNAPLKNEYGYYTDPTIYSEYNDYLPWIKLVSFLKGATHEITLNNADEDKVIQTIKWIDIVNVGNSRDIKIKYSNAKEFPNWYIDIKYIKKIKKL